MSKPAMIPMCLGVQTKNRSLLNQLFIRMKRDAEEALVLAQAEGAGDKIAILLAIRETFGSSPAVFDEGGDGGSGEGDGGGDDGSSDGGPAASSSCA
jgi:hypothetical protein